MEKLLKNKKQIGLYLFYIAFIMEILILCFNNASVELPYRSRLFQIAALLFGIKILLTRYSVKEWLLIVFCGFLSILCYMSIRETLVAQVLIMLLASKDIEPKKIIKIYFYLCLTSMLIMGIFSAIGWIDNFVQIKDFYRGGIEKRYSFGFNHPNVFYSNLLNVFATGFLVYFEHIKFWHYVVLTAINFIFFGLTASRTGFIVIQILIIIMFFVTKFSKLFFNKVIYISGYVGLFSLVAGSYVVLIVDNAFIWKLNELLTGRIILGKKYAPINTWTWLPNRIERNVIDMGYINVMATWGIILGVVYIATIFFCYRKFYKEKDLVSLAILLTYSIFTMIEAHAFSMYFVGNIMFLIMIGWGKDKIHVSEEKPNTGVHSMRS